MTKNIAATFVAIMLLAQIGIAQHNVVHITDHGHYEHNHEDNDHKKSASEACQICVLTKSLSFGLAPDYVDLTIPTFSVHAALNSHDQIVTSHQHTFYTPRAPPSFFI